MPHESLKQAAVSATLWSGLDAFARQGFQFIVSIVLARLLTPADFGTVGLLAIFIGFAGVLIDSGFSSALIQRKELDEIHLSSVFYFNIVVSILAAASLCLAAPWIANFYRVAVLVPLTWVFAGSLIISSITGIQGMLLTRALNFRKLCYISLIAQCTSSALAIWLAWSGFGVWSLAVQSCLGSIVSTILLWITSEWRPRAIFSIAAIRSLFRFGSFLLLSATLEMLFSRLNSIVIGRFYSPGELGYYSRADNTCMIPGALVSSVIGRVAFPLFSAARHDPVLLRAGLRKAITMAMMINIPAMLGMIVTARPLVLVLFGEKWLPCVPYLQILSVGGILWPLHVLNLNILTAQGHSNLFFRLELVKKGFGIVIIGTTAFFGITAIAWGMVGSGVISFCINAYYSGRFVSYGALRQTSDLMPYVGTAGVMAGCTWAVSFLAFPSPLWLLATQIVVGVTSYVFVAALIGLSGMQEAWRLIAPVLKKWRS